MVSKDVDLLQSLRACLTLRNAITAHGGGFGEAYRLQWKSRLFYAWLNEIGLTRAKSLTIGPLRIPDEYFADFVRGCIDGDGSIVTYVDEFNATKNPKYVYDRLYVSLVSASPCFVRWIQRRISGCCDIAGDVTVRRPNDARHHELWRLRYAKRESLRLLQWLYYSDQIVALRRKRERAARALAGATWYRHPLAEIDARLSRRRVETGKRFRLKTGCPKGLVGSSPTAGTTLPSLTPPARGL